MNELQSRKQLLIAESELNRAQLAGDLAALKADVRTLTDRARSVSTIVSTVALVMAAVTAFRRGKKAANAGGKLSWLQTLFNGGGLISTIWKRFRPPESSPDKV